MLVQETFMMELLYIFGTVLLRVGTFTKELYDSESYGSEMHLLGCSWKIKLDIRNFESLPCLCQFYTTPCNWSPNKALNCSIQSINKTELIWTIEGFVRG